MEYKFVRTTTGPVVLGEDEVLFFGDFNALVDYIDSDPEFVHKAKLFVAEGLRETADNLANSMFNAVVGGDQTQALYGYIGALRQLRELEHQFLPAVLGQHSH
ncbi:hypothetical protein UFOVP46_12 [uncultured Caudovirales phage]|uniref:Uncharacterized protein n=1 Tax=uncultured Caudovirales phage TaxID=2100421 RepID=A0A6J5KNR5_9CAUD|nr:hypothetical protein UFOVP46_12 [uncultured Caudovirales phage]